MKKYIVLLLLSILSIFAFAGCGSAKEEKAAAKPLRVGMNASYAPFGSQNVETKAYEGFDVDIIQAIADEEKFPIEIVSINFDGLIPALQTHDLDIVINDMGITPERSAKVLFSKPYYYSGIGIVLAKDRDDIKGEKDLAGKTVGVCIASTGETEAKNIEGAIVKTYNTTADAFLDLQTGGIDAVINDSPVNDYYIAKKGEGKLTTIEIPAHVEEIGIAVAKDNQALMDTINKGLATIQKNGKYAEIYKKWFGKEPPAELAK